PVAILGDGQGVGVGGAGGGADGALGHAGQGGELLDRDRSAAVHIAAGKRGGEDALDEGARGGGQQVVAGWGHEVAAQDFLDDAKLVDQFVDPLRLLERLALPGVGGGESQQIGGRGHSVFAAKDRGDRVDRSRQFFSCALRFLSGVVHCDQSCCDGVGTI